MMKKKLTNWKQIIKKMQDGTMCTADQDYLWLYGCYKAYLNPKKDIDNRDAWWNNISKRFQEKINKYYQNLEQDGK